MTTITAEKVRSFLDEGGRTGKVGYLGADGRPLVVPVWFARDGDRIVFNTSADSAKAAAIARDPRLAMCVDEQSGRTFVQIQGDAETTAEQAEVLRVATTVAARYVGAEKAERVGGKIAGPGQLAVYLRPTRVTTSGDLSGQDG
ncbi:TIGR03618 family F420-dependent PPOX class oxidoreductase [Actinopolyspora xinjiangensis]|nr:TIGR03618 family F420-dependent PPOX class oxidoreductase [Actinopolyspora xinjiangensis]